MPSRGSSERTGSPMLSRRPTGRRRRAMLRENPRRFTAGRVPAPGRIRSSDVQPPASPRPPA
jgi:hypothetical protein